MRQSIYIFLFWHTIFSSDDLGINYSVFFTAFFGDTRQYHGPAGE